MSVLPEYSSFDLRLKKKSILPVPGIITGIILMNCLNSN